MKTLRLITAAMLLTLAAGACSNMETEKKAEEVTGNDAVLEAKVKKSLIQAPKVDAAAIGVQVHNGVATLTGFADGEPERQRAELAASRVEGIKRVINEIETHDATNRHGER
jgi:osmotically-inducible protein OsmY